MSSYISFLVGMNEVMLWIPAIHLYNQYWETENYIGILSNVRLLITNIEKLKTILVFYTMYDYL